MKSSSSICGIARSGRSLHCPDRVCSRAGPAMGASVFATTGATTVDLSSPPTCCRCPPVRCRSRRRACPTRCAGRICSPARSRPLDAISVVVVWLTASAHSTDALRSAERARQRLRADGITGDVFSLEISSVRSEASAMLRRAGIGMPSFTCPGTPADDGRGESAPPRFFKGGVLRDTRLGASRGRARPMGQRRRRSPCRDARVAGHPLIPPGRSWSPC